MTTSDKKADRSSSAQYNGAAGNSDAETFVAEAPARLAAMSSVEEVFDLVREAVPILFPGSMVLLYRSSLDGTDLEVLDVFGIDESAFLQALRLIGFDPRGRHYTVDDNIRAIYARTTLHHHEQGLAEFSASVLPASVAWALERMLSIHQIHSIGLAHGEVSFGTINVFVRQAKRVLPKQLIESFAHQCFLAMSGLHSMARLRESERRYRALLQSLPLAVQVVRDGSLVYCNPAGLRLLGIDDVEQLRGVSVDDLADAPDRSRFRAWLRAGQAKTQEPTQLRVVRRGGERVQVESTSSQVEFDGAPASLVVFRDMTAQKAAESALLEMERDLQRAQKLEGLGVLAGGVAHDFNNLLAAVVGNLFVALDDLPPGSPARAALDDAAAAARRAIDITRLMLTFSGQERPDMRHARLSEILGDTPDVLRAALPPNVALDVRLADDLPLVEADRGQVRQVVTHLVANAAESYGDRQGRVVLSTGAENLDDAALRASRVRPTPAAGSFAYLEVADEGSGIEAEVAEKMFEPFFTTKFVGRGLGLAAVMGIVREHGGAILLETAPLRGSRFRVYFPTVPSKRDRAAASEVAVVDSAVDNGTFLVVDDDPIVLRVTSRMLGRLGYTTIQAADGVAAVEAYRTHAEGLFGVILDVTLPRMNGIDALREMRAHKADVPIVMASGLDTKILADRLIGIHVEGVVSKPITLTALAKVVRIASAQRAGIV